MCDETHFKLLEQKVENIDETVSKALMVLSKSVDESTKSLGDKIDRIENMLETKYVSKGELTLANVTTDAKIDKLKEKVVLLQRVVYGAVSVILLTVLGAWLTTVIR